MNIPETEFVRIPAYDWHRAVEILLEDVKIKEACIAEDERLGRFPETITALQMGVDRNKKILRLLGHKG